MKSPDQKSVISMSDRLKQMARDEISQEKVRSENGWSKDLAVHLTKLMMRFNDLNGTWCPGCLGKTTDHLSEVRIDFQTKAQQQFQKIQEGLAGEKFILEYTLDGDIVLTWQHRTCTYVWTP